MSSRISLPPYRFRDENQKKECILQSLQLSRDMLHGDFPKGVKDQTNLLIYLGTIYLLERTLARKVAGADSAKRKEIQRVFGLTSAGLSNYVETEAMLRKATGRFFTNPMKTALLLSGV